MGFSRQEYWSGLPFPSPGDFSNPGIEPVSPVLQADALFSHINTLLKLNIQETKIMASGPITSWQIDGETVETVAAFIFGAPKSLQMVTAAMKLKDACSLERKL